MVNLESNLDSPIEDSGCNLWLSKSLQEKDATRNFIKERKENTEAFNKALTDGGILAPLTIDATNRSAPASCESRIQNSNPHSLLDSNQSEHPYSEQAAIEKHEQKKSSIDFKKVEGRDTYEITQPDGSKYRVRITSLDHLETMVTKQDENGKFQPVKNRAEAEQVGNLVSDIVVKDDWANKMSSVSLNPKEEMLFSQLFDAMRRGDLDSVKNLAASFTDPTSFGKVFTHLLGNTVLTDAKFSVNWAHLPRENRGVFSYLNGNDKVHVPIGESSRLRWWLDLFK